MHIINISEGITYQPSRPKTGAANWVPSYSPLYEAESILFNRDLDRESRSAGFINLQDDPNFAEIIRMGSLFGPTGYEPKLTPSTGSQTRQIKRIRRALNKVFRKEMVILKDNLVDRFDPRLKESRRAYTQHKQWEAQVELMIQAQTRKEERQDRHARKMAKMQAKKVDGKTPKQVKKGKKATIKKVKVSNIEAKKASIAATKTRNNLTQGMGFRALIEANINNQKILSQGKHMRTLVTALMTKEVQ